MTAYLDRPGGRIAYDDTGGDGQLAVLVPGMGDTRVSFRFFAPALAAAGYRVVTMDLRGAGESDATFDSYTPEDMGDDLVALLAELDAGPALVVGASIAAAAAVWAAAEAPERVAALVLLRAYPPGVPIPLAQRVLGAILLAGPWAAAGWSLAFKSFFPSRPPADLDAYRARLRAMLREPGRVAALRAMAAASKDAANARMAEVTQPTLVVLGAADVGDPAADARAVADAIGGEVALIPGAGHYPHVEHPQETLEAVLAFARRRVHA
ncbi:MAG TPA: alpha/beta hydrolase [Egibacteraceae bacterium]